MLTIALSDWEQRMLAEVAGQDKTLAAQIRLWLYFAYFRVFYPEVVSKRCPLCKKRAYS